MFEFCGIVFLAALACAFCQEVFEKFFKNFFKVLATPTVHKSGS